MTDVELLTEWRKGERAKAELVRDGWAAYATGKSPEAEAEALEQSAVWQAEVDRLTTLIDNPPEAT